MGLDTYRTKRHFDRTSEPAAQEGAEPELHRERFARTREAAYRFKDVLDGLGLAAFLKTSGKTGGGRLYRAAPPITFTA